MPEQQLELSLPFEDFTGSVGSQAYAKATYKRGNDVMVFKIPFKDIQIWDGYNARRIYEGIEELADSLIEHKQKTPFKLVLVRDRGAFLMRGGRRHKAYQLAIEQGRFNEETEVPFEIASTKETMEEMILDLYISNNLQQPLTLIELSTVAFSIKHNCGEERSNEAVADIMKVSRQKIDNLIELANLSDELKNQIYEGKLSATHALTLQRSKKKLEKQAAKKEEEAGQTSMYQQPGYVDPLKSEMEDLEALDIQSEQYQQAEKERQRREQERLERDAVLVPVEITAMAEHLGKRLAADAVKYWEDNAVDPAENDGKESVKREEIVLKQGTEINEESVEKLMHEKVEKVYIFKEVQAPPSVITQEVAEPEKSKYDNDRIEIGQIQNIIKLADRIAIRVEKLDVPEGDKKDLSDWAKWLQKDAFDLRDWVHSNKKQNKRDR